MEAETIIITSADVADPTPAPPPGPDAIPSIPLWWRFLSALLIFCPPLLFAITVAGLLRVRRRDLTVRHAHTLHYCCLLLTSGILWTLVLSALAIWKPSNLLDQVSTSATISLRSFPSLPSTNTLTGRDVAQQLSPLVVVVHQSERPFFPSSGPTHQPCGAGAITFANRTGCLVLTSRHVIDAISPAPILGKSVGVTLQDGQRANALVVGLHHKLDLALLWVKREESQNAFSQPLRSYKSIEVGEQVFVIGHPEGLQFSLSGGLVAQTRGDALIQMSAPVSPGNSGGPVYDIHGQLVAIVQSVFDKTKNPNAENLNFAVRADDLLLADAWTLLNEGRIAITTFAEKTQRDGK